VIAAWAALFIHPFDFFYAAVATDLVSVALGILVLILERNDPLTRFLARTGIIFVIRKYFL
jgi:hypothetical protein